MKKLFILLTCIAVLASCSKGNEWDSDHPININVRETLSRADTTDTTARRLTPKEIVQQTWSIQLHNVDEYGIVYEPVRGFSDAQIDTVNWRLKMWSTDIIDFRGNLMDGPLDFLNSYDVTLIKESCEVIAYIPNSVLETAREEIISAYNDGDYDRVYDLFDDAYTAIPITQAEYDELVKNGEQ